MSSHREPGLGPQSQPPSASDAYFAHSTAKRVNTDAVIAAALTRQYPDLHLSIVPRVSVDLLAYAAAGHARATPLADDNLTDATATAAAQTAESNVGGGSASLPTSLAWDVYVPPARRLDGSPGAVARALLFGKFAYHWRGLDFILYIADGRDGGSSYPQVTNLYLMSPRDPSSPSPNGDAHVHALILAAGQWASELHDEIWVFDGGRWLKDANLYRSVRRASWDAVILDPDMKKALIEDHLSFFNGRETYEQLRVPWKRGVIYYGPPGNGKTISIKAMMNTLYSLDKPVPTLYVRTLASFAGPEYSIQLIFRKARQYAPCYLVFEDLDSIVSDGVRSYFLNEVDGLQSNDGIFMIGSTNHLDRLDPGIAASLTPSISKPPGALLRSATIVAQKRPSRFDRKYLFPNPSFDERVAYARFWQGKLAPNPDIEFPDELCAAIARITDDFSFAYMQEAFVAALLAIARDHTGGADGDGKGQQQNKDREEYDGKRRPGAKRMAMPSTVDGPDDWVEISDRSLKSPATRQGRSDLDKLILWVEIQKQVKILREGMEDEKRGGN
ncbi:ATP-dependent Zn protease [Purpureocillium lilacinum]|uniref:ATP-dependent Zn protease n=1 Tax=Purpureocillium lilacinum TaxID=33203 RepID=A0A179H0N8_PURLI|nr:ATP-dependent Zn protease [Purpureocillium lilacinum]OAQ74829.1 ATP-dependent Zn protease [Purpureocillium lilacinum]OAQ82939.1 ATP-dependent Zn protease [Purpureocillium lilacinum]GJN70750.1 hypothetical protein PLICBS_004808 [Purpureocillium lilacinum]GJN79144.1 hypothetical protein PLIIFM63780_002657 [Purpureocillium lilacinum]